jgi:hypothetical protein
MPDAMTHGSMDSVAHGMYACVLENATGVRKKAMNTYAGIFPARCAPLP